MSSSPRPQSEAEPIIDATNTDEASSIEGIGTPIMVCPQIRKSRCNFYHWDKINGKHTERPCSFSFVSEKAYQCHVFETHQLDYDCIKQWYTIKAKNTYRSEEGEVAGRLPRYLPDPEPRVIDRRVREDAVKMIKLLDSMFRS